MRERVLAAAVLSTIIPQVRHLDLSDRPWENSFNVPVGPNDPVEDHQYLFFETAMGDQGPQFKMTDLESMLGPAPNSTTYKSAHAMILNEYGWLWLNRDGTPTLLTQKLYPKLLGDKNTTENRVALYAYLLGGETEFSRAYRHYAGILQFVYLTASDPKAFTSDSFRDLKNLQLEPHFVKAMEQAFNPLGVYLNFWQLTLSLGEQRHLTVAMVNDEDRPRAGKLLVSFTDAAGKEAAAEELSFSLPPLGAESYDFAITAPQTPGSSSICERMTSPEDDSGHPTMSHGDVVLH